MMRRDALCVLMVGLMAPWLCPLEVGVLAVKCVGSDGCGCSFDDGTGQIDVSSLGNSDGSPRFKDVLGPDKLLYSFNPCRPFNENKCTGAAVCQVSEDKQNYTQVGDADTITWLYSESTNLTAYYENRYPGPPEPVVRESFVTFDCDPAADTPAFEVLDGDGSDTFYFRLTTKCACPNICVRTSSASSLSAGSVLIILIVVAAFVYLVGGILYNRTQKQAAGVEMIPNIQFWRALPGLVKDGCLFLTCQYSRTRRPYDSVQ